MTATLGGIYAQIKQKMAENGIKSADFEARLLIKHRLGLDWAQIIASPDHKITKNDQKTIENDLERRLRGEPLSRIHGTRHFYGLEFALGPDTLDPRPDTEILVDAALEIYANKPPKRILDLGTGTGCIIIALLKAWPESTGLAVDISPGALETAKLNAQTHDLADRLSFQCGSWGDGITERFDLIVSNPPYIPESDIQNLDKEVRNHDPILALSGGFDGLDAYKKIFSQLSGLLNPGGKALFEIGFGQEADIMRLGRESRIRIEGVRPDYAGITRVVEISNGDK